MEIYRQRHLLLTDVNLACSKREDQWFDRKSARIDYRELAKDLVAFANADGGTIVVGLENDGSASPEGLIEQKLNDFMKVAQTFTEPPVITRVSIETVSDINLKSTSVLIFEVPPDDLLHQTTDGNLYMRVGDSSIRQDRDQVRELEYRRGRRSFDREFVNDAKISDLNRLLLVEFAERLGKAENALQYLTARGLLAADGVRVNNAAVLLFTDYPQRWLPNSYVRVLKYEGVDIRTGDKQNFRDVRFEGPLVKQIVDVSELLEQELGTIRRLDERTGRFQESAKIPRFAWQEALVNAVAHRSYSLQGDHIRIRIFDDRLEVENPGRLAGSVRIDNIRQTRFSRNPTVTRALSDYSFVQELNEGINRMFSSMVDAGLPEPVLEETQDGFRVTLLFQRITARERSLLANSLGPELSSVVPLFLRGDRITIGFLVEHSSLSRPTLRRRLRELERLGILRRVASSETDPTSYWVLKS